MSLKTLLAGHMSLGNFGAEVLARSTVRHLDVTYNHIRDEGCAELLKKSWDVLVLTENRLGPMSRLLLSSCRVSQLYLGHCYGGVNDEAAKALAKNGVLTHLDLYGGRVSDEGAIALAKHPTLEWLNIGDNHITDCGVKALATMRRLRYLDLGSYNFPVLGDQYFPNLEPFKQNPIITTLLCRDISLHHSSEEVWKTPRKNRAWQRDLKLALMVLIKMQREGFYNKTIDGNLVFTQMTLSDDVLMLIALHFAQEYGRSIEMRDINHMVEPSIRRYREFKNTIFSSQAVVDLDEESEAREFRSSCFR